MIKFIFVWVLVSLIAAVVWGKFCRVGNGEKEEYHGKEI